MIVALLFGLLALFWLGMSIALIGMPGAWLSWVRKTLDTPLPRYGLAQGMLLMGVLLVLGRGMLGTEWLWLTLGTMTTAKGLVLLGSGPAFHDRLLRWWAGRPLWLTRGAGVMMLALAALLALGTVRFVAGL